MSATPGRSRRPKTRLIGVALAAATVASTLALSPIGTAGAVSSTVVVKPSSLNGWIVDTTALGNPAVTTTFTGPADASAGTGSFQFGPIGAPNQSKLETQAPPISTPVADFGGMQYDFQVLANAAVGVSAKQFYAGVYADSSANGIGTYASWYDCRFTYVPLSSVAGWNTFSFNASTLATAVAGPGCPTSIGALPAGSELMFFRLSGGDTSANDNGLIGAYDLVAITIAGDTTTYDFEPEVACTTTCYVDAATGNDAFGGDSAASAKKTIQAGVTAVNAGGTVVVAPGTYTENVTVAKALTLESSAGRAATTIQGITNGAVGTVLVTNNVNGFVLGGAGKGFTVVGIDNPSPGIESAAVYLQGNHAGATISDNEIVANGEAALIGEFGGVNSGFVIDGNTFSGQSFVGPNPAGSGFGSQFSTPNVPRQLVTIGGGTGGGNTSNITFTDNVVSGVTGGYNTSAQEQGNTVVTIDSVGALIEGNTFAGTTSRFATQLRSRGPNSVIRQNVFDASNLIGIGTGHIYTRNNTITVERNSLAGSTTGLAVEAGTTVNALCNWWGDASGPSGAGSGSGSAVALGATFTPWLISNDLDGLCDVIDQGTEPLDASGDEGDTLFASGSFTGTGVTVTQTSGPGSLTDNGGGSWSWSYGTTDNESTSVEVTGEDAYGNQLTQTFNVDAANVDPTATFNAPVSVSEGASFSISLTGVVDPSSADTTAGFTYAFDCGAGFGAFGASSSASCTAPLGGTITVQGTVEDKDGGFTTYSQSVSVLSGLTQKQAVLAALQGMVPTGDSKTDKKINDAIKDLTKAIDPGLWIDGSHPSSFKVFNEEKNAVNHLMGIKNPSPAILAAINSIWNIDRVLAETAIAEAVGGDPIKLAKAAAEMAKAATDVANGDFGKAIDHYRNAWKAATEA